MEPVTDVRQITHVAYGFKASKALLSAVELGIFGLLADGPLAVEGLASATRVAPNRMESLLTALASLGLLAKSDDGYSNAPASQECLVPGRPSYMGDYLILQTDRFLYPAFADLTAVLRGESASSVWGEYQELMKDPETADSFSRGQHAGSVGPAIALARQADLTGRRRLLDVGGGSGAFTISLCRRNPELSATILDFANALDTARRNVAEADLTGRVDYMEGNALEADWPANHDVVLMSWLLSAVGGDDVGRLTDRAHAALPTGGLALVHDFMVDDDLTGPVDPALWFLTCMFNSADARALTPALIVESLESSGFGSVEARPLIPDLTSVVTAHKSE